MSNTCLTPYGAPGQPWTSKLFLDTRHRVQASRNMLTLLAGWLLEARCGESRGRSFLPLLSGGCPCVVAGHDQQGDIGFLMATVTAGYPISSFVMSWGPREWGIDSPGRPVGPPAGPRRAVLTCGTGGRSGAPSGAQKIISNTVHCYCGCKKIKVHNSIVRACARHGGYCTSPMRSMGTGHQWPQRPALPCRGHSEPSGIVLSSPAFAQGFENPNDSKIARLIPGTVGGRRC